MSYSSFSAVDFGPLYYRNLEKEKIKALKRARGNFDETMNISESMKSDLSWCIENVHSQKRVIDRGNPDTSITCDASLEGWGAVHEKDKTNGRWTMKRRIILLIILSF